MIIPFRGGEMRSAFFNDFFLEKRNVGTVSLDISYDVLNPVFSSYFMV